MKKETCKASGQPLPDDARADYEADPECTHFYCAACGKLLRLPTSPAGTVRRHTPGEGIEPWPFSEGVEPEEEEQAEQPAA